MVRVADDDNRGPNPMQRWKIGAVTVTSVVEYDVPLPVSYTHLTLPTIYSV